MISATSLKSNTSQLSFTASGPTNSLNTSLNSHPLSKTPSVITSNSMVETASMLDSIFGTQTSSLPVKFDMHMMKKIPPQAEAANILIGEIEELEHPVIVFVRLTKAKILQGLLEVPVPTRFMFLLLGPSGQSIRNLEIGRCAGTVMSDEVNSLKFAEFIVLVNRKESAQCRCLIIATWIFDNFKRNFNLYLELNLNKGN